MLGNICPNVRLCLRPNFQTISGNQGLSRANRHLLIFRQILVHNADLQPPRFRAFNAHHLPSGKGGVISLRKAATVKQLLQRLDIRGIYLVFLRIFKIQVNIFAVNPRYPRHIFRAFHSALNFQRCNSCFNQLRQNFHRHHVLRGKQISLRHTVIALIQRIGQAAGLRAASAVAASAAQHAAHNALPRIANTKCPMHKGFDFRFGVFRNMPDFLQRKLSAQHDFIKPTALPVFHIRQRITGHLRACMQGKIRKMRLYQSFRACILHNERIHAHFVQAPDIGQKPCQLLILIYRIYRYIHLYAAQMAIITGILQFLQIKIPRILPCAELLATQIDRITVAVHCRLQALHGTRRGKQLRSIHSRHNSLLSLSCKPVVKEKSNPMKFSQMLHRHAAFRYFFFR